MAGTPENTAQEMADIILGFTQKNNPDMSDLMSDLIVAVCNIAAAVADQDAQQAAQKRALDELRAKVVRQLEDPR